MLLLGLVALGGCKRSTANVSEAGATGDAASAFSTAEAPRPPLRELVCGTWTFESIRDAKVDYDRKKLESMSWELTPTTMLTYVDHRLTHEERYLVVSEEGDALTMAREGRPSEVVGTFVFIDDDTVRWQHPTFGVLVMTRAHRRAR